MSAIDSLTFTLAFVLEQRVRDFRRSLLIQARRAYAWQQVEDNRLAMGLYFGIVPAVLTFMYLCVMYWVV